jgi:hypothetical protein
MVAKSTPAATGPPSPTSRQAKRATSVVRVRAEGELEAVAGELRLRGADHRRQLLGAGARHQRVQVGPVLGPDLRDQLAAALRVAFVPGGDVIRNGGVRHGREGARRR